METDDVTVGTDTKLVIDDRSVSLRGHLNEEVCDLILILLQIYIYIYKKQHFKMF